MRLTRADHDRIRDARAAMIAAGEPLPRYRSTDSAAQRGGGANPAFIRLQPPQPKKRARARRKK